MNTFTTPKGTKLPLLNLQGKDYLQVSDRLIWFREEHPSGCVQTEYFPDHKYFKATIYFNEREVANGHYEVDPNEKQFGYEKAETGAIGRALAIAGFGTQFTEISESSNKLADAPREQAKPPPKNYASGAAGTAAGAATFSQPPHFKITEKQVNRLWAISKSKGMSPADVMVLVREHAPDKAVDELNKEQYDKICLLIQNQTNDMDKIPF